MFGKKKNAASVTPPNSSAPSADPLSAARQMAVAVFDGLVKPMKLQQGLPSPVIAAALGTLAGHACQVAALHGLTTNDPNYRGLSLVTVGGKNGDHYFFGDAVNRPVLESQHSVWALVAGVAQKMSVPVPALEDLVSYVASTSGGDAFGVLRDLPKGSPPVRSLLMLWGAGKSLSTGVAPDFVPVAFALTYQRLAQTDNEADPSVDQEVMARVMMEATIAASKLQASDLELGQAPAR